ncbi:hypothetical protein SprV_0100199900 [Sparganum proliferum]
MEARESASADSGNPDATRELVDKAQRRSTNPPKAARRLFQGPLTKILPSEERSNGMDECQKLKLELTKQNVPDDSQVYVFYLKTGTERILGPFIFSCHPWETAIAEAGCLSPKQRREYIGVKKVLQKLNSVIKDPARSGQSKEGEAVLKPYHDTALSQLLANALGEEGLSIIFSLENTVLRLKKDVDRLQTENAHLRSSQPQFVYSYPYGLPSPQSNLIPRYVTPTVVEKAVQYNFEPPTLVDMSVMAEEGLLREIQTENRAFRDVDAGSDGEFPSAELESHCHEATVSGPTCERRQVLNESTFDDKGDYNTVTLCLGTANTVQVVPCDNSIHSSLF